MIYQRGYLARPLDVVLGNASRLAVARVLAGAPDGLSGRQIAARAGINHQAAALALRALASAGLVAQRDYGRSILWRLDRRRTLVEEVLLPLAEAETRHVNEIVSEIKGCLDRHADAVVIVGEAAKGRLSVGKPLALVVLCEHGKRRALMEPLRTLQKGLDERYALALNVSLLTKREAASRLEIIDGWQLLPTEGRPSLFALR